MSTAGYLMRKPITVEYSDSMATAMRRILSEKVSRLAVARNGEITGIITEKDIGLFLLNDDSEKILDEIQVSEAARPIVTVDEAMSAKDCAALMYERGIGSLGVNSRGATVGILTKTDLTRHYRENHTGKKRVGDLMTVSFVAEYEDEPLSRIISKMVDEKVSRLILKDRQDELTGIVAFRDFFRIALTLGSGESVVDNSDPAVSVIFSRKGFLSDAGFGKILLAKEIMTGSIIAVDHDDDVVMACAEMIEGGVNGVGVRINGKVSGILSKTDIVRAVATI